MVGWQNGLHNNKKILIIDDINRGGDALSWIMNDWKDGCHPDDTLTGKVFGTIM